MSVVMKIVFSLSLSGSVLILVLFFCKPFFKDKFSKQWQYYIWLIVIARLILPFAPNMSIVGTLFSNLNPTMQSDVWMPAAPGIEGGTAQVFPMEEDTRIQYQEPGRSGVRSVAAESLIRNMGEKILQNLWIPWSVIALILLIRKITIYQGFVRYVRMGRGEVSNTALLDRLAQIGERAGVRRPVELYEYSQVSSPLLIGFFRPCIVLTDTNLPEADFVYIIWHELVHYKRKDMFYKWLVQFVLCLHWFNPLVWLMAKEISRACELSCDEAVVKALDEKGRRAYGDTLFRALGTGGGCKNLSVSIMFHESVELLKERLSAIMKVQKSSKIIKAISVVSVVVMMMGATVMGAYVEPATTEHIADKKSLEELVWQYYEADMPSQFGAVFSAMDEFAKEKWLDKVYVDGDSSFFSAAVNRLDSRSPLIEKYVERAYREDKIDCFAILTGSLDSGSPLIDQYAKRAYEDGAIDFFSILLGEMSVDTLKSWRDRAKEEDMDLSFRTILMDSSDLASWKQKAEQEDAKQYQEWGITREGENFYYQNQLVRVFFDQYDGEQVIRTLVLNPAGAVDVKVTRSLRNKIIRVEYMTAEEVEELFGTEDLSNWDYEEDEEKEDAVFREGKYEDKTEEFDPDNDVYRLTQEELPADVIDQMMDNGAVRTWYVYHSGGQQYLCYRGFAWSYGYQLTQDENGWEVHIQRFQKQDFGDVFLALPDNGPVTVYCDGEEVALTEIEK